MYVFSKKRNCVIATLLSTLMIALSIAFPFTRVSAANLNTSQTYSIFSMKRGGTIRTTYTLGAAETLASTPETRHVIGNDSRVADNSKLGVVKINIVDKSESESGHGTGFVVGDSVIATAAHCVYSGSSTTNCGMEITNIEVYGESGELIKTITDIQEVHVPNNYITSPGDGRRYDYALITVGDDLSEYANFNLGVMMDGFVNTNTPVTVTGFPGGSMNGRYSASGTIQSAGTNDSKIYYDVDTSGGESGGPVYITSQFNGNTYYTVIGIHTHGNVSSNSGTRMNTDLLHFYKNNPNL